MHDNHVYNLMCQLVQEQKSLWRIKNNYLDDADECAGCQELWKEMIEDKEEVIEALTEMVKKHLE